MDNGTDFFKAGFSGNRVLPTVTLPCTETNSVLPHHFLYEKERIESGPAKQTRPLMKRHCWMDLWRQSMDKLKINLEDTIVPYFVVAESELNVESERKEMIEILFEQSKTSGVYFDNESSFSLIWHGTPTGVIVDCGDLITSIVPFHNCERLPNDVILNYGDPTNLHHVAEIRKIKEKYGRVDVRAIDSTSLRRSAEVIDVSSDVFRSHQICLRLQHVTCTDGLFQPSHFDNPGMGIQHAVIRTVESQVKEIQAQLYGSVLLCGGTTMYDKFPIRLRREFKKPVNVIARDNRRYSVWLGANKVFTKREWVDRLMIRRFQYCEEGLRVLHRTPNLAKLWLK
ncbi:actin-like isoform X2 [Corticium candelabrum]|uniref:actin-like isoform X2 n=1 Tax=Corticium candelabrum TaxID=121492 RepID=UPI002E27453E|nr:actin-like isoform X2 [Corticium candelabrum]